MANAPSIISQALERMKAVASFQNKKFRLKRAPVQKSIKPLQREYLRDLNLVVSALMEATDLAIVDNLDNILFQSRALQPNSDSLNQKSDDVTDLISRAMIAARLMFVREYSEQERINIAKKHAGRVNSFNAAETDRIFGAVIGVNFFRSEPYLESAMNSFVSSNVSLITSISDQHFSRIEQSVLRAAQAGTPTKKIKEEIQRTYNVSKSRAALIARDQTAKLNSNLTQFRQREVGIKKYEWSTSGDERVRDSHRSKDGKIFSWNSPPSDTGHPGEDFQCRCVAIPVFDDV